MPSINSAHKDRLLINSSNSVIWDGEDLPCIKLCKGDTVSTVTYKLAVELCAIKVELTLTDIDLKTVFEACMSCPQPVKTLHNILQLIINKIETIDDIIGNLDGATSAGIEPSISLTSCFLPYTNAEGDPITKLPHSDYTRLIAITVCSLYTQTAGLTSRISVLESEYNVLLSEISLLEGIPLVSPFCTAPTNSPIPVTDAYSLLEQAFCNLRTVTGLPGALAQAAGRQPTSLSTADQLSGNGTMSSITGWKATVETIADSVNNQWLVIEDIRGAVKAIQDNCCKVNCSSIIVDFDIKLDDTRTFITLFFANKSKIPVGFADCDILGNILTITDSNGATADFRIKVADEALNISGIILDLSATPIDPRLDYTFNLDACMSNGDFTCQKCINKSATYKDTCSYCEISVTGNTSTGSINGELVIVYQN